MRTYSVPMKTENLSWDQVTPIEIDNRQWANNPLIFAWAKLMWDKDYLYVRLEAKEPNIRAEEKGLLGSPCEDSCLEFFFCPMKGDLRYFNIETNPNGCTYLGFATSLSNLIRLIPEVTPVLYPEIVFTNGGWQVTYAVPATFVRQFFPAFRLEKGKTIRANFYKCGDNTEKEHYMAWNKIGGEKISFHQPKYFGKLILT